MRYVEYGTKHMSAQPYLRVSLDENKDKIEKKMKETLKAAIEGATR